MVDLTPQLLTDIRDEIRGLRTETREGFEHMRLLLATALEGQSMRLRSDLDELRRRVETLESRGV